MKVKLIKETKRKEKNGENKVDFSYNTESVYKRPGDDSRVYAVFSTIGSGFRGSAVCAFTLDAIENVFKGRFKEQATSSSSWLPVLSSKVPQPRPGECVNDTQALPGNTSKN